MLHHLEHISTNYPIQRTILGGDWNFVLHDADTTSTSRKPRTEAVCRTILDTLDLYDVAALQSTHPGFTYFRHQAESTRDMIESMSLHLSYLCTEAETVTLCEAAYLSTCYSTLLVYLVTCYLFYLPTCYLFYLSTCYSTLVLKCP